MAYTGYGALAARLVKARRAPSIGIPRLLIEVVEDLARAPSELGRLAATLSGARFEVATNWRRPRRS